MGNWYVNTSVFEIRFTIKLIELETGEKQILRLAPWGKHDLTIRSFADR